MSAYYTEQYLEEDASVPCLEEDDQDGYPRQVMPIPGRSPSRVTLWTLKREFHRIPVEHIPALLESDALKRGDIVLVLKTAKNDEYELRIRCEYAGIFAGDGAIICAPLHQPTVRRVQMAALQRLGCSGIQVLRVRPEYRSLIEALPQAEVMEPALLDARIAAQQPEQWQATMISQEAKGCQ